MLTFVDQPSGDRQVDLVEPAGVAIDRRGIIFVADRGTSRIELFSRSGLLIKSARLTFSPTGIDLDEEAGVLNVADSGNKVVAVFDLNSPAFRIPI